MVIKIATEKTPHLKHFIKRYPFYVSHTYPGRGLRRKVKSKWTDLKRVFNREVYTNNFGNSRFIMLVNIEKLNKWKLSEYNQILRPLGFEMINVKNRDVFPVFNNMGLNGLSNAMASHSIPTMIIYAYGNELSPIGNPESLSLIKKLIKEFHNNPRKSKNYILAGIILYEFYRIFIDNIIYIIIYITGAIDRELLTKNELISFLEYKKPMEYWNEITSTLNMPAYIPSLLIQPQMILVNMLQYYIDNYNSLETQIN